MSATPAPAGPAPAEWPSAAAWLAGAVDGGIVVQGVPLAANAVTPSRYDLAPGAIRGRLAKLSSYDARRDTDLRAVPVTDLGDDLEPVALDATLTVLLGGHNGVTFEALRRRPDLSRWGLLTFDAHHDVRPYAPGPPGNGSPVRALVDAGLPGSQVVQVGIGAFSNSPEHRRWCEAERISVHGAEGFALVPALLDELAGRTESVYVDVDIDVLDRAFAPGAPGARPGGVAPATLFEAVYAAGAHPSVRAVDVVEVDPAADVASLTVDAAALCLLHVASGWARRRS